MQCIFYIELPLIKATRTFGILDHRIHVYRRIRLQVINTL